MQSGFIKRVRDIMRKDAGINGDAQRIEQMVWMLFLKVYDAKEDDWELNEDNYISIIPDECRWRNWAQADDNGHAMTGDKLLNFVNNTLFPTLKELPVTPDTPVKKAIVKSTFEDANNYMKDGVYLRQVVDIIDEIEFDDVKESHALGFVYEEILRDLQAAGSSGEFYTPRAVTDFMALMIQPKLGEKMADFACGTGGFITSWLGQLQKKVTDTKEQKQLDDNIYGIEKKPFPYLLCVTNMLLHDIETPNIFHRNSLQHNLLDYTDDDRFDVIMMNPPFGGHEDESIKNFFPSDLASSETADLFMSVIMYRLKKKGRAAVIVPDSFLSGLDNVKITLKQKLLSDFNLHTIIKLPSSVFAPYTPKATNILFFDKGSQTTETWIYRLDIPVGMKHFSKSKPIKIEHFDEIIKWWGSRTEIEEDGVYKAKKYVPKDFEDLGYNLETCCPYTVMDDVIERPQELFEEFNSKKEALNEQISKVVEQVINRQVDDIEGNGKKLGLIDRVIELYQDIPDKLQRSILQEAMEGRLSERLDSDTPIEFLVESIKKERASLEKNKKCKKVNNETVEEKPFDIPEKWIWVSLEWVTYPVGNKTNQIQTKDVKPDGDIPVVSQGQNLIDGYCDDKEKEIVDLPLVMFGDHTRNVKYIDFPFVIGADGTKFHHCIAVNPKYIYYWMMYAASTLRNRGYARHYSLLKEQPIPLPPIEEQERIVKELDGLISAINTLR